MLKIEVCLCFVGQLFTCIFINGEALKRPQPKSDENHIVDLNMPGVKPQQDEQYTCFSFDVIRPGYIVEFIPTASSDRVHHLLLYGCISPGDQRGGIWNCLHHQVCDGRGSRILYAWARNAPSLILPGGVGVPVGKNVDVAYYVLQVHYARTFRGNVYDYSGVQLKVTNEMPPFLGGIYLMMAGWGVIPPKTAKYPLNISCLYDGEAVVYPFAYRTHAHSLGQIITAYKHNVKGWTKIGKGNPQWPQRFYPVEQPLNITSGDILTAQCVFDSTNRSTETNIGSFGGDEMCNFYLYYYVDNKHPSPFGAADAACVGSNEGSLFSQYPPEASEPLPYNSSMLHSAEQATDKFENRIKRQYGSISDYGSAADSEPPPPPYEMLHVRKKPGPGFPLSDSFNIIGSTAVNNAVPAIKNSLATVAPSFAVMETKSWPSTELSLGQIAGLCLDTAGNLVVFHRADRLWTDNFNLTHYFMHRLNGPIMDDTVVTLNAEGSIIKRWGRGLFYMPHGIFIDHRGFLWATDTAMHQVFKFDPSTSSKDGAVVALLALGHEFQPGTDVDHFCKPAAVAVSSSDGSVFVADGYCNDRLMKFDSMGKFLAQFGEKSLEILPSGFPRLGTFTLPHAISLDDSNGLIYVADRENFRVQILNFNGYPTDQLTNEKFGAAVYGVYYCSAADVIFVINGESTEPKPVEYQVFVFDAKTRRTLFSFMPENGRFQRPHVIVASPDCKHLFIGEIGPNKLWRFEISSLAQKKEKIEVERKPAATILPQTPAITKIVVDESSWLQLAMILTLAIVAPSVLTIVICCCCRFKQRGGLKGISLSLQHNHRNHRNSNGKFPLLTDAFYGRSHKGFQPLRTEDADAMDDLTDDSDTDDAVFTKSSHQKHADYIENSSACKNGVSATA